MSVRRESNTLADAVVRHMKARVIAEVLALSGVQLSFTQPLDRLVRDAAKAGVALSVHGIKEDDDNEQA